MLLVSVEKTVVEDIDFDEETGVLVASVRPTGSMRNRCGVCQRRSPRYDTGAGRRRWRALDAGTVQVHLEADAPRVSCRSHGVTVAAVPWARHQVGHTHHFDAQVAWLATQTSKTAVTELMRIAWRTVGAIITRVWGDVEQLHDRFADLRRIGIDAGLLQARAQVRDRSRRPRQWSTRLGRSRPGQGDPRHVL